MDQFVRYTFDMESEALYIALLIAPWAVVLAALLFYRQRRKNKTRDK